MESHPTRFLHTAIRECDLGALSCYLTTKACEEARHDFAKMLGSLVEGYIPPEFKVISETSASRVQVLQTPRVRKRDRVISLMRIKRGSSGVTLSKVRTARPLKPGTRLFHSSRGFGRLVQLDPDEPRGKHFLVAFDSGESHHYDVASLHKMKVIGSDSKMQSIELIIDGDAKATQHSSDTAQGIPASDKSGSAFQTCTDLLHETAPGSDALATVACRDAANVGSDVELNRLHLAIEHWIQTPNE
jgi:hypothetical protein